MSKWQPIETAPRDSAELLVYTPDDGDGARMDFDYREDGVWALHAARYEEFMAVGGAGAAGPDCVCVGPSEKPAYTHWMPLPDPPTD